jgi:hypothetical protein
LSEAVAAAPAADLSAIPAGALPPGVDAAAYVASKTQAALPEVVAQTPADVAAAERPANVPEKFWDPVNRKVNTEGLLKSYTELETKLRQGEAKPAETPAADKPAEQDPTKVTIEKPADAETPAASKTDETPAAEAAPVATMIESLTAKYNEGKLDDASFAEAEKAGFPRQVIETYFAGLKALEATEMLSLETAAGGKETLTAARNWAATGLDDKDLAFYNANVTNPATAEKAVQWLAEKYKSANPSEGKLVNDTTPPGSQPGEVFRSATEVTAAMADPKYKTDPAFRQTVAEKLQRSRAAGTYSGGATFFSGTR